MIFKDEAWKHYKKALFIGKKLADKIALSEQKDQNQINSIQLGLGLNYAVFLWEIVGYPDQKKYALRHLKRIIQRALDDFDHWKEEEREKISQQVELIKENINQWQDEGVTTDSAEENWAEREKLMKHLHFGITKAIAIYLSCMLSYMTL